MSAMGCLAGFTAAATVAGGPSFEEHLSERVASVFQGFVKAWWQEVVSGYWGEASAKV